MADNTLSVLLAIQGDASGAISALSTVERGTDSFAQKQKSINTGMVALGGGLTAMGAKATGTLLDAGNVASDFDQKVRTLGALTNEGADGLEAYRQKALQLGKDTVFSAGESIDTMKELAKAGLENTDILNGGAQATLNLAAASGTELPRSVEVLADSFNSFRGQIAEGTVSAESMSNTITKAANASSISVNDFGYSMSQSGAVASLIGIKYDDLSQAIALMGKNGIKGSDAGTSLKTMMLNLTPLTTRAADTMQNFGLAGKNTDKQLRDLSANGVKIAQDALGNYTINGEGSFNDMDSAIEQASFNMAGYIGDMSDASASATSGFKKWEIQNGYLASSFYDAEGNVKSFTAIAGILQDKLGGLDKNVQVKALHDMFGTDAIRAASILTTQGADGFKKMGEAMDASGDASTVANARMSGMKGSTEQLSGSIETAKIVIGDLVNKALQPVVDFATKIVNLFISAPPEVQGFLTVMLGIAAALGAIGGPLLIIGGLWPLISGGLAAVATAAGPVILVIGIIVGAFLLLKAAWDNNLGGIQTAAKDLWDNHLAPMFHKFGDFLAVALPKAMDFLGQMWKTVWEGIILPALTAFFTFLSTQVIPFIETVVIPAIMNIASWLGEHVPQALQILQGIWTQVWGIIQQYVIPVLQTIFTELSRFWTEISPKLQEVWNFISGTVFPVAWNIISTIIGGAVELITNIIKNAWDGIAQIFQGAWTLIQGIVEIAWGILSGTFETALNLLTGHWEDAWNSIGQMLQTVWDGVQNVLKGGWEIIQGLFNEVGGIVKGIWDTLWGWIGGFVTTTWDGISKTVTDAFNGVMKFLSDTGDNIKTGWDTFWNGIWTTLGDVWKNISDGVTNKFNEIKDFLIGFPQTIWNNLTKMGGDIIGGVVQGLSDAGHQIWDFISGLLGGLIDNIKGFFGIKSPSTLMRDEIGKQIPAGMAVGIGDAFPQVNSAINEGMNGAVETITKRLNDFPTMTLDGMNDGLKSTGDIVKGLKPGDFAQFTNGLTQVTDAYQSFKQTMTGLQAGGGGASGDMSLGGMNKTFNLTAADINKKAVPAFDAVTQSLNDVGAAGSAAGTGLNNSSTGVEDLNQKLEGVQTVLDKVTQQFIDTFGTPQQGKAVIHNLMFSHEETSFFKRLGTNTLMFMDLYRLNVWEPKLQMINDTIAKYLTGMTNDNIPRAFQLGYGIAHNLAEGILNGLPEVQAAMDELNGTLGGAGGSGSGSKAQGSTTNNYYNVRNQNVDNSNTREQTRMARAQGRYSA